MAETIINNNHGCKIADLEMENIYNSLRSNLSQNPPMKDRLKMDQLNWLNFRTEQLNSLSTREREDAFVRMTRDRIKSLRGY